MSSLPSKHAAAQEYLPPQSSHDDEAPFAHITNPLPQPFSPFSKLPWRPVSQYTPSNNIIHHSQAADFNNRPSPLYHTLIPSSSCSLQSPNIHASFPIKTEQIMTEHLVRTTTASAMPHGDANAYADSLHQDVSAAFGLQLHGNEYNDMDADHLHQLLTLQAQHELFESLFHGDNLLPILQARNKQYKLLPALQSADHTTAISAAEYKLLPALQSADHATAISAPEYSSSTSCFKSTGGMKHGDKHCASTSTQSKLHYTNMHSNYKSMQTTEQGTSFEANVMEPLVLSTKCTGITPRYSEGRATPEQQVMPCGNLLSIINNPGYRLADGGGSFGLQDLIMVSQANSSLARTQLALCSEKVTPYNAITHKPSTHKLNDHTLDEMRTPMPFGHYKGTRLYSMRELQSRISAIHPRMQTARLNASAARDYAKMREAMHSRAAANRRKRIQERLTALRALVPGGAKIGMHLASMLELASKYVRFLQAQHLFLLNEIHIDKHSASTPAAGSPHNGATVHMANHSIQELPVCPLPSLANLKSSETDPKNLHEGAHTWMPSFLAYLRPSTHCQASREHIDHFTESFCAQQSPTQVSLNDGQPNHGQIHHASLRPVSANISSASILADSQLPVNMASNRDKCMSRTVPAHVGSSNDVSINVKHALHVQGDISKHSWAHSAFSTAQFSTDGEHVLPVDDENTSGPCVAHAESAQILSIGNMHNMRAHVPLVQATPVDDIEHDTQLGKRRRVSSCGSSIKLPSVAHQKVLFHHLLSSQQVQEHLCRTGACLVTMQQAKFLNYNPPPHFTG